MNLERYCVRDTFTLKEVAAAFERRKHGRVVIVLDENNKVVGVASQGDLLRALSSGKDFFSRIIDIVQPSYLYLTEKNFEKACELFKNKDISLLPVINNNRQLVDVVVTSDIYQYLEMKAN